MTKDDYLDAFERNRARILAAGDGEMDLPVHACPGWDVAALIGHVGGVYTFWSKWVRERPRGPSEEAFAELMAEREEKLPGYQAWRNSGFGKEDRPEELIDFARRTGDDLAGMLRDLDSSEPVWTFHPTNHTIGFVQRRIAQETSIHAWDAEAAQGVERPIPTDLARDGIDEYMTGILFIDFDIDQRRPKHHGQRFQFREQGGPVRWHVTFSGESIKSEPEEAPADVTITGSASDLNLFLLGRRPNHGLEVEGDRSLVAQWQELAGTF